MSKASVSKVIPLGLLVTAISFFAALNAPSGRDATASAPVNISQSTTDSGSPHIGLDAGNAVYAVWVEAQTPRAVYFATNKGGSWSSPLSLGRIESGSLQAGYPALAVSSAGVAHLTYNDARPSNSEIYHRAYESSVWGTPVNVSANTGTSIYSACAVSPMDNTLFVVWMDDTVAMWDLHLKYRDAAGVWSQVQTLPLDVGYTPSLAIDAGGTAHLVWSTRFNGNSSVWYSKNTDPRSAGLWTLPLLIKDKTGEDFCFPQVACDAAGNADIVWIDRTAGNDEIFYRPVAADTTLGPETNVSNSAASSGEPAVAVEAATGHVAIAWTDSGDVFFNSFTGSWTGPANLTNTGLTASPSLAVDAAGLAHLLYSAMTGSNYDILYTTATLGPPPTTTTSTTTSTTTTTTTTSTTTSTTTTSTTTTTIRVIPSPPIAASLATGLDPFVGLKFNTFVWYRNLENRGFGLSGYRVYRKTAGRPDAEFTRIADVSADDYQYQDGGLSFETRYAYKATAVSLSGYESDGSDILVEDAVHPPLDIGCETVINRSLASREKINIITWSSSPLNTINPPVAYNLFRKFAGQEESAYVLLATVSGDVFEYKDRKVASSAICDYALTAVDESGNESRRSEIARAKQ